MKNFEEEEEENEEKSWWCDSGARGCPSKFFVVNFSCRIAAIFILEDVKF